MAEQAHASSNCKVSIHCIRCNLPGYLVWDTTDGEPMLMEISNGFYERVSKKARPFLLELVCDVCGAIQPKMLSGDQSLSTEFIARLHP
jgi:hypothetical protein